MEEIHGYVEAIVFSSEETGFTVARIQEPKKSEWTTATGILPQLQPGENISCKGEWKVHPQFGRQFHVSSFELKPPTDLIGLQKYLESGMVKGVGKGRAKQIIDRFGLRVLDVIDQTPTLLLEIPGIGPKRLEKICTCWQAQKEIRTLMIFLRHYEISPSIAQKIYRTYGQKSIQAVQANPYALAKEVAGIGFKSADKIAEGLGIAKEAPIRICSAIEHKLWEMSNEGHTCFPKEETIRQTSLALELPSDCIAAALEQMLLSEELIEKEELLFLKPLFFSEQGIAKELLRLKAHESSLRTIHEEKALRWLEQRFHFTLDPTQWQAIQCSMSEKISIITGGPGTGKSTITKAILALSEKLTDRIILAAPTGRAAKRLHEITYKKAFTIHSLLEMDFSSGLFKKKSPQPSFV
jgi:exodeoxyribonuclease V alpha subunit